MHNRETVITGSSGLGEWNGITIARFDKLGIELAAFQIIQAANLTLHIREASMKDTVAAVSTSQSASLSKPELTLEVELQERSIAAVRAYRESERLEAEHARRAANASVNTRLWI
jgi:hypothetical protein